MFRTLVRTWYYDHLMRFFSLARTGRKRKQRDVVVDGYVGLLRPTICDTRYIPVSTLKFRFSMSISFMGDKFDDENYG